MAGSSNIDFGTALIAGFAGLLGFGIIGHEIYRAHNHQKSKERYECRCRYESQDPKMSDIVDKLNERLGECYHESEENGSRYVPLCISGIEREILGDNLLDGQRDKIKMRCDYGAITE